MEEALHGFFLSSPFEMEKPESTIGGWTCEENKLFENALAEIEPGSPSFFETVASKIPWKSTEEIKDHYQVLIEDLSMIESGRFPVPDYQFVDQDENEAKTRSGQHRRRGVPWTEDEHQLFLMGLNKYGKGDWRSISRYYVITKTPTQVASHAQKYFRRQTSSTPMDRRRPSIHDIQTVNPAITLTSYVPQNQTNYLPNIIETVSFTSDPILHSNYTFPYSNNNPIFEQTSIDYPESYLIPSPRDLNLMGINN